MNEELLFLEKDIWKIGTNISSYISKYFDLCKQDIDKISFSINSDKTYSLKSNKKINYGKHPTLKQMIQAWLSLGFIEPTNYNDSNTIENNIYIFKEKLYSEDKNIEEKILSLLETQVNKILEIDFKDDEVSKSDYVVYIKKNILVGIKNIIAVNNHINNNKNKAIINYFNNDNISSMKYLKYWNMKSILSSKNLKVFKSLHQKLFYGSDNNIKEFFENNETNIEINTSDKQAIIHNSIAIGLKTKITSFGNLIKYMIDNSQKIKVPLYQRKYSWTEKLINNLLDDINDIGKKEEGNNPSKENHFVGTLIFKKKDENIINIVDGQQRITTLMVILTVWWKIWNINCKDFPLPKDIYEIFVNENKKNNLESIFTHIQGSSDWKPFVDILRGEFEVTSSIESRKSSSRKKENTSKMKNDTSKSFRNAISSAFEHIQLIIKESVTPKEDKKGESLLNFLSNILNKVFINITYNNNNQSEYSLFETINTSSLKLSNMELIKNTLLSFVQEKVLDESEQTIISYIQRYIEKEFKNDNSFINNYINFFISYFSIKENITKECLKNYKTDFHKFQYVFNKVFKLEKNIKMDLYNLKKILIKFNSNIKYYKIISYNSDELSNNNRLKEILDILIMLRGRHVYHPLIAIVTQSFINLEDLIIHENDNGKNKSKSIINKGSINKLRTSLFEIERYEMLFQIVHYRGQSIRESLNNIAQKILSSKEDISHETIINEFKNLDKLSLPKIETFSELLITKDVPPKTSILLLNRVEYILKYSASKYSIKINGTYPTDWDTSLRTLEHIIPETLGDDWKNDIINSQDNINNSNINDLHSEKINKIGNHMILTKGDNSKVSNSKWEVKKNSYKLHSDIKNRKLFVGGGENPKLMDLEKENIFNFNVVDERTKQIAEILSQIYKY